MMRLFPAPKQTSRQSGFAKKQPLPSRKTVILASSFGNNPSVTRSMKITKSQACQILGVSEGKTFSQLVFPNSNTTCKSNHVTVTRSSWPTILFRPGRPASNFIPRRFGIVVARYGSRFRRFKRDYRRRRSMKIKENIYLIQST